MSGSDKGKKDGKRVVRVTDRHRWHPPRGAWLTTLLSLLMLMLCHGQAINAGTLVVGIEYTSIGDALDDARDGDIVEVREGEYREALKIERTIHLKGVNQPVIRVADGRIIQVTSPGVIVEGFTLTYDTPNRSPSDTAIHITKEASGVTIRNNRLLNVMFGISNVEGTNLKIENNTIIGLKGLSKSARGNGINLTGSQGLYISGNRLRHCRDGIYMELCHDARVIGNVISDSRYSIHTMWVDRGTFNNNRVYDNLVGLAIMYTKHSRINDNLSYGNQTHGLLFIQAIRGEIKNNTVIGNTKGIFLYNSVYNDISSNLIMNNQLGIHSWGGSEENTVHGNSFIANEIQVKHISSKNQEWNDNYWSDYIGWDMTGDGIGEYPYESNSVVDHILWLYPLAKILYTSPSLQLLWMLEKQFPLFKVPRIVDLTPAMSPYHGDWKVIMAEYARTPARFYGELEKLPHLPGGG